MIRHTIDTRDGPHSAYFTLASFDALHSGYYNRCYGCGLIDVPLVPVYIERCTYISRCRACYNVAHREVIDRVVIYWAARERLAIYMNNDIAGLIIHGLLSIIIAKSKRLRLN